MVTKALIQEMQEQKDIIMNAMHEMQQIMRRTEEPLLQERFRSYVRGGIEQVMEDNGMHNICAESLIESMNDYVMEEECDD